MEKKRRCGWIAIETGPAPEPVVWARGRVATPRCPTSYITSESVALLEEYYAWKLLGAAGCDELPARLVEAIFVLENELRTERDHAEE